MFRNWILTICFFFVLSSLQAQFKTHQFFDQNGNKLSFEDVLVLSEEASLVFFGELHNNSLAHWFQLQLLKGLQANYPDLVLAAEFFERDDQLNIEEWFAGKITEKNFEAEAKLWNNYQTDYRPLMRYAKDKKVNFVASNVPRKYASLVSRGGLAGLDSLSGEAKKYFAQLPITFDPNLPGYVAMKGMMHGAPGNADFMVQAQALKDATMAEGLFPYIDKGRKILHINGSYHSKNGEGILWFLWKKYPDLKILNIHTVEQDQLESLDESHAKSGQVILVLPTDSPKSY